MRQVKVEEYMKWKGKARSGERRMERSCPRNRERRLKTYAWNRRKRQESIHGNQRSGSQKKKISEQWTKKIELIL